MLFTFIVWCKQLINTYFNQFLETFRSLGIHISVLDTEFDLHFPPRHLYISNGFIMQDIIGYHLCNRIIFTLSYERNINKVVLLQPYQPIFLWYIECNILMVQTCIYDLNIFREGIVHLLYILLPTVEN